MPIEPMLGKLFGAKAPSAAAPAGERLYAVGDIHGCEHLLSSLMAAIEKDAAGVRSRLIFLGDYVDRGPDSKGVVERLLRIRKARPDTVFLKGNHEQALADFLAAPERNEEWLHWGGDKTLESYGVANIWARNAAALAADLAQKIPAAHRAFFEALELWRVFGDYVFVHAGFRPGVALENQTIADCLWIRGEFHNAPPDARPDKVVVHGHHPVRRPVDAGWRIDVDTGAVWSEVLTCVVLEGTTRRFLSTG